ncbi:MAG: UMP kinase [Clostridia bacterium]|nr:UMP kinase [Clostridia bacterium]
MAVYHRVLLKLSGEALKADHDLFDFEKVNGVAKIIRRMHDMGVEIGIVIGAGNIWRGRQGPSANMDAVTADQMGMLGTVINCLCVADALRKEGLDAVVQSAVDMTRFAEPFNAMAARRHLSEGRVVLFACGTGNPFFSTDSGVALRAIEMEVDAVLMAKNIDGVYTADPAKDPTATLIKDITYADALAKGLKVMDASAFALCAENKVPMVRVFGLDDPENLIKVLEGDEMGTFVHP